MELFDQNGCLTEEGLHAVIGGQLDELGRMTSGPLPSRNSWASRCRTKSLCPPCPRS